MPGILTLLTIGLPWIGALIILMVGDGHRRLLNILAVSFAVVFRARGSCNPALRHQ